MMYLPCYIPFINKYVIVTISGLRRRGQLSNPMLHFDLECLCILLETFLDAPMLFVKGPFLADVIAVVASVARRAEGRRVALIA